MPEQPLSAVRRESIGRTPTIVRRAGFTPAVLYGHGVDAVSLAVNSRMFQKMLPSISSSTLLEIAIDGEASGRRVLLHDIQRHPLSGQPIHADFYQVNLRETIEAAVRLEFIGVSPAVKDLNGTLSKNLNELEVEALPQNLPARLNVDISRLATFEDQIRAADVILPTGVSLKTVASEVVAVVTPPRSDAEMEELEAAVEDKVSDVKTAADEQRAAKEAKEKEEAEATKGEAPAAKA